MTDHIDEKTEAEEFIEKETQEVIDEEIDEENGSERKDKKEYIELLKSVENMFIDMNPMTLKHYIDEFMEDDLKELLKEYHATKEQFTDEERVYVYKIFERLGILRRI